MRPDLFFNHLFWKKYTPVIKDGTNENDHIGF